MAHRLTNETPIADRLLDESCGSQKRDIGFGARRAEDGFLPVVVEQSIISYAERRREGERERGREEEEGEKGGESRGYYRCGRGGTLVL